ncbi:hypothetical protein IEO21_09734 [Rhodonia placenta]|uniref:C2 domain-containing protein n=1 Tax=Rhodonia placenta TaxID=104341 RepID=A0A8H7NU72_9APHY|nr:hypothetical protein IEO21_09734 [Postia placenta]
MAPLGRCNMNKCSVVLKVINASGISIKSVVKRKPRSSVRIRVNKDRVYETTTTDTDVPVWNKEFKIVGVQYDTILSFCLYDNGLVPPLSRQSLGSADRTVEELLKLQPEVGGITLPLTGGTSKALITISIKEESLTEGLDSSLQQTQRELEEAVHPPLSGSGLTVSQNLKVLVDSLENSKRILDAVAQLHPYLGVAVKLATSVYNIVKDQLDRDMSVLSLVDSMSTLHSFVSSLQALKNDFDLLTRLELVMKSILLQTVECLIYIERYRVHAFAESAEQGDTHPLDDLYDKALHSSLDRYWLKDYPKAYNAVLGVILAAKEPISVTVIDQFLEGPKGPRRASKVLSPLRNLLRYSNDHEPVHLLHLSFRDFISNPDRCDKRWFVDVIEHNRRLASRCMDVLRASFQTSASISQTSTSSETDANTYACTQWILHICDMTDCPTEFARFLQDWLEAYLINWLEAMSALGKARIISSLLEQLLAWVEASLIWTTLPANGDLRSLVYDGVRFSAFFSETIATGPSLVRPSALPFAPTESRLFKLFHHPKLPTIMGGYLPQWSPALRLFDQDTDVDSLAFSPDGRQIVSSGPQGAMFSDVSYVLRVWDVEAGTEAIPTNPLDERSFATFSPDGTQVWAASAKGTIYRVDTKTGYLLSEYHMHAPGEAPTEHNAGDLWTPFYDKQNPASKSTQDLFFGPSHQRSMSDPNTHSDNQPIAKYHDDLAQLQTSTYSYAKFTRAAFSHEGLWVVLGQQDGSLWLVDLQTRTMPYAPLQSAGLRDRQAATRMFHSIDFSPDDSWFASGSGDGMVYLWDRRTGNLHSKLAAHTSEVTVVKFISSNTLLSSAEDGSIIMWDLDQGLPSRTCTVPGISPDDGFEPLAFSSDGTKLAACLADGTLRILDVTTGEPLGLDLIGHFNPATAAAFSCDKEIPRLVSAAFRDPIHFWDLQKRSTYDWRIPRHHRPPHEVSFFSSGLRVISWRNVAPWQTKVWDAGSGREMKMSPYDARARLDSTNSTILSSSGEPVQLIADKDGEVVSSYMDHSSRLIAAADNRIEQNSENEDSENEDGESEDCEDGKVSKSKETQSPPLQFDIKTGVLSSCEGKEIWMLPKEYKARSYAIWRNYIVLGLWNCRVIVVYLPEDLVPGRVLQRRLRRGVHAVARWRAIDSSSGIDRTRLPSDIKNPFKL